MIDPSMEDLILNGVLEVSGIDSETGEFLYSFTEKLKEAMPELWNERLNFIHDEIMYFWELGFLEVDDTNSKSPVIFLTELAFDEKELSNLSKDKLQTLNEIKRLFEK